MQVQNINCTFECSQLYHATGGGAIVFGITRTIKEGGLNNYRGGVL